MNRSGGSSTPRAEVRPSEVPSTKPTRLDPAEHLAAFRGVDAKRFDRLPVAERHGCTVLVRRATMRDLEPHEAAVRMPTDTACAGDVARDVPCAVIEIATISGTEVVAVDERGMKE